MTKLLTLTTTQRFPSKGTVYVSLSGRFPGQSIYVYNCVSVYMDLMPSTEIAYRRVSVLDKAGDRVVCTDIQVGNF